jgi:hypothetical protein
VAAEKQIRKLRKSPISPHFLHSSANLILKFIYNS